MPKYKTNQFYYVLPVFGREYKMAGVLFDTLEKIPEVFLPLLVRNFGNLKLSLCH
jgi:hypothetical protein